MIGGLGADKLYGGRGADMFVLKSYKESLVIARDTIYDFSRAEKDKIDLSGIDARSTVSGNQAFTFIGTKEFSEQAGELRYFKKGGDTFFYGDLNGDAGIDFSIRLDGTIDLAGTDFIL
jgi:serralysin